WGGTTRVAQSERAALLRGRQVHHSLPSAALEKLAWLDGADHAVRQLFRSHAPVEESRGMELFSASLRSSLRCDAQLVPPPVRGTTGSIALRCTHLRSWPQSAGSAGSCACQAGRCAGN